MLNCLHCDLVSWPNCNLDIFVYVNKNSNYILPGFDYVYIAFSVLTVSRMTGQAYAALFLSCISTCELALYKCH